MSNFIAGESTNLPIILQECQKQGLDLSIYKEDIAYILATAKHETANFQTLTEYASGAAYEGRTDLGNSQIGDGVKFKGRGYVQITGRNNYSKFSKILGQDLVANPELCLEVEVAAFILVFGMKNGSFTGMSLENCVLKNRATREIDFLKARRIVNGTDQAKLIEGYANFYLDRINSGEFDKYSNNSVKQSATNIPNIPIRTVKVEYPDSQTWEKIEKNTGQKHTIYLKNMINYEKIDLNLLLSDYADRVNEKEQVAKTLSENLEKIENLKFENKEENRSESFQNKQNFEELKTEKSQVNLKENSQNSSKNSATMDAFFGFIKNNSLAISLFLGGFGYQVSNDQVVQFISLVIPIITAFGAFQMEGLSQKNVKNLINKKN